MVTCRGIFLTILLQNCFTRMAHILVTGGTGTVGKSITKLLIQQGFAVCVLTRTPEKYVATNNLQYAKWDVDKGEINERAITAASAIIHLAGEGVADKRWNAKRKQAILDSRVKSGELLVKKLQQLPHNVTTFISSSAIGWYGPDTSSSAEYGFAETQPHFNDFLGNTCYAWEQSTQPLVQLGIRCVWLRTGIVLSNTGGALIEFKRSIKLGVAAILSNGLQKVSWISIKDLSSMFLFALQHKINGVYNAVAPAPSTNKHLTLTLAKLHRGSVYLPIHVPAFFLKIMLGEMSIEVLKSCTVNAEKIQLDGFHFEHATIEKALHYLRENPTL